jgi:nicotinamidase-related amidase
MFESDKVQFCIDMQHVYGEEKGLSGVWHGLKKNITSFTNALSSHGISTVFVAYMGQGSFSPFDAGIGLLSDTPPKTQKLLAEYPSLQFDLGLQPHSFAAFKNSYSIFRERKLRKCIKQSNFETIYVSGVTEGDGRPGDSGCCVTASVLDLADAGFDVVLVEDGTHRGFFKKQGFLPIEVRRAIHDPARVESSSEILKKLEPPLRSDVHPVVARFWEEYSCR